MSGTTCLRFHEDLVGLLEGTADAALLEHVASCDLCRDARHDFENLTRLLGAAGDDFALTPELMARLESIALYAAPRLEAEPERISETRRREANAPLAVMSPRGPPATAAIGSVLAHTDAPRKSRRTLYLSLAAVASIAASTVIGFQLANHRVKSPEMAATRAWHGKVAAIARSGADKSGGLTVGDSTHKTDLGEGAEIKAGMHLSTDGRTRARLELDDGTVMVLDRATSLSFDDKPRTVTLADGAILADVAHVEAAPAAWVNTPAGRVKVIGTKIAVTSAIDRTNVEVLRGEVEVTSAGATSAPQHVSAGQEGVVSKDGKIDIAPANDLAQRAAFGEELALTHNEDTDAPASGLGELRARRPGRTDEKDHAVHLAKHAVKVRIAGDVARTEIDETFSNDTSDDLEGIYRFPLPPGAQIERLALEVDGALVEGEFVEKAKAAAIWRGAIHNAAPQQPKPREEIVWVPGPWRDPALLEWSRGGRFELKIFPIPKKGSRRVVIAYTETVAPVAGVRRYVYPLPLGSSSQLTIDDFSVDAQVLGHDAAVPVRARGYELTSKTEGSAERLSASMSTFTPSGDLAIEYGMGDKTTDATVWAYTAPPASTTAPDAKKEADAIGNDAFVAIALRPKLPNWADTKPRDQVIVLDSGRAMFGERFARAKRLAVQIAQEMDRRDRLTVIACDVSCKTLPGGFAAPGAPTAHDVDAFLTGLTPDGASDLVGAVRAATNMAGHEKTRDLRVVVLSDGVATAGYRSNGRIATEVGEAVSEARSEVIAVPIGADADVPLLGEIARGGGGVVVPYQPGQRLEATALEILNATYGSTLRDVQVTLPEGLHDMTPATLPPLRAGSETIVTARLTGEAAKGDLVLRGKVGGDPFEAKYAIDAKTSTDSGNAFVPRLFAAARIADRERDATDAQKTELVALSRRFAVPSRFTSLLVLESEAMFKAFGIDRTEHAAQWTGETVASSTLVASQGQAKGKADDGDLAGGMLSGAMGRTTHAYKPQQLSNADPFSADEAPAKKDSAAGSGAGFGLGALGNGAGVGGGGRLLEDAPAPATAATSAPDQQARKRPVPAPRPTMVAPPSLRDDRGGRFMKRVFVRQMSVSSDASPTVAADKVQTARTAVQAAPDERGRHKELAKLLALSGQLDELGTTLEKWSERDPLDADVIVGRSDLAARRGDREGSLRILSGALAASALKSDEAFLLATTIARSFERLGRTEACSFSVTAAELRPTDADAMARAVACERRAGRVRAADRWLDTMKEPMRTNVSNAAAKIDPAKVDTTTGDIVVTATWDSGADLDIALLDPSGRRAGVATRMKGARIEGATSHDHETLALATNDAGAFVVEMVRADVTQTTPVSGRVVIRAGGQSQTIPFTLSGARTQVGRVDARWEAQLVPFDGDAFDNTTSLGGAFDRAAAQQSLAAVNISQCSASGQVGTGHATITFSPSTGRPQSVVVDDATFSGTPAGRCLVAAYFTAAVPQYSGSPQRVGKSFTLGSPR